MNKAKPNQTANPSRATIRAASVTPRKNKYLQKQKQNKNKNEINKTQHVTANAKKENARETPT